MAGSVQSFDEVMNKVEVYVKVSEGVGKDVQSQAELAKQAFAAQKEFLKGVPDKAKPSENELGTLLKPTSEKIAEVQVFKDKHHSSPYVNHYLGVSEAVTALGWVTVPNKPGDTVKQIIDSTKYYTNRVLKETGSNPDVGDLHKKWVAALIAVLTELENFVRKNNNNGLSWGR